MGRFIPDDVLEQIRLRTDIVQVVQSYVPMLKKSGMAWKACCPFHQEKTPSFTVNEQRQSYKCFGCGKGGNVFTFIMEMERLEFPDAVEMLARKVGVVLPEPEPFHHGGYRGGNASKEKSEKSSYSLRERLYTLQERLAAWYAENLANNVVPPVCEYFKTRKIDPEFTRRFMIGASPDSWNAAIDFAHRLGYTDEELRLAGVVSEKDEHSQHIYDRFRNRLMFPIWNETGRVVAFSARSIEKDPQGWKYLNSPETPVFKKSRTLYALHFAKAPIESKKYAVLCEGQLDVIALHRAGCDNAVAAQGTAFGTEHAAILKRHTREIRLALDNDKAGRKAVFADAEILLPLGFQLKVVTWPNAKDADEVMKSQGPEAIRKAVADDAVDFFEFALQDSAEKNDISTPPGKAQIAADLLGRIQLLDSSATQEAYLAWLAGKLELPAESLRNDLARKIAEANRRQHYQDQRMAQREFEREEKANAEKPQSAAPPKIPFSESNPGVRNAFRELLKLILADESLANAAAHDIEEGACDETPVGIALDVALQATLNGEWNEASSKILMELAKSGIDMTEISGIITGSADEEKPSEETPQPEAETPENEHGGIQLFAKKEIVPAEEKAAILRRHVYDDCVRVIRTALCRSRMAELMEESKGISSDDPDYLQHKELILKEMSECARQIRELSLHR